MITAGLVVGLVAVSFAPILARYAMGSPPVLLLALGVAFWRTAGGAAVLGPFALRARRRRGPLPAGRHRQLFVSGAFLAVHFGLFLASLALTTVASASTLATTSPLFVAAGSHLLLDERTSVRTWVGMALSITGAVVVVLGDTAAVRLGARALLGDLLAFGSAVAICGYLLIGRRVRGDVAASTYSAVVYGVAAAALVVVNLAVGTPLLGYDPTQWLAIVGIVVGPQLLGHTVFNTLLSSVSATVVSVVIVAEPVGATLLAWLLFDELPAPLFWLGGPLVLVGVILARRGSGDGDGAGGLTATER